MNIRQERIEKLLDELKYEVTRGMMEKEIPEEMGFRFIVPTSHKIPGGAVQCEFYTQPKLMRDIIIMHPDDNMRLRVVK